MSLRLVIVLLLWGLFAPDGSGDGRTGNEHFREGRFQEAAAAYRTGLEEAAASDRGLRARLLQNLGSAQYRMEEYEAARSTFEEGLRTAEEPALASAIAYDAGNAAYRQEQLREAADLYRRSLLADPDNRAAKYNYELVKRRLENQQSQSSSSDQSSPNEEQQDGEGQNGEQQGGQQQSENESSSDSPSSSENPSQQNEQSGSRSEDSSRQGRDPSEQNQGSNQQSDRSDGQQQNQNQDARSGEEPGSENGQTEGQESGPASDDRASSVGGDSEQRLSEQEARRILQALETSEKRLLRELRPEQNEFPSDPSGKDW